jgi:hypothetical protein
MSERARMHSEREFQAAGPANVKARSPNLVRLQGLLSSVPSDDRRPSLTHSDTKYVTDLARYGGH